MASFLETGAVSVLSYANRLIVGAASLVAAALSPTLLPHFSRLAARGETDRFNSHYIAIIRLTWWGSIVMAGAIWVMSEPVVALLYEHGNFTRADSLAVSNLVGWFCLQFPPMLAGVVGSTLLIAAGHNRVFLPLSIMIAIVNAGGNLALMPYYGLSGIALSTIVTYLASLVVINIVLIRRGIIRIHRSLLRDLAISLTTAAAIGTLLIIEEGKLSVVPTSDQLLLCTVAAAVYCVIAYICTKELFSIVWRRA
jgi:putative peptidoglycan lipid II flippase